MAEKTLKTRIINKHATLGQWQDSTLVLKEGEIALAKITTQVLDETTGNILYVPRYLMKIGEGNKTFNDLQWLAAPASDVYAWAKLEDPAVDQLPATLKGAIKDLQASLGTGGSVTGLIKDAIAELDVAESKDTDAENGGVVISTISETDGKISVTRRALIVDDIPALGADKITSGTFADARIANASKWNTAATQAETNKSNLAAEVTAREATDSRVTALENTIQGLSGAMHFVGTSTADPVGEGGAVVEGHTTFKAGDVCLYKTKEYVYNGTNWIELGDEGSHLTRDEANKTFETIAKCDAIRTDVTNLQSDVSGLKTSVGDGTSGLVKDVTDLKVLTATHTDNIAANAKAVKDLADGQVTTNKTNIGTLQSGLEALTTEVGKKALADDLTAATNRITALETSVGTDDTKGLRKQVVDLEGVVGSSTSGLVKDVADLKSNKADASALQSLTTKVQTGTFISDTNQFVAYNGDELILDCGGAE